MDLVWGSYSDCGQHHFDAEVGPGRAVTGSVTGPQVAPWSVERRAASACLKATSVPLVGWAPGLPGGAYTRDGMSPGWKTTTLVSAGGGGGPGGGGGQSGGL